MGCRKRIKTSLLSFLLFLWSGSCQSLLRYTKDSCSDLVPKEISDARVRNFNDLPEFEDEELEDFGDLFSYKSNVKRHVKKRQSYFFNIPYTLSTPESRYRRNSDVEVHLMGQNVEALILQARTLASEYSAEPGLVGRFRKVPHIFTFLPCFDNAVATVVDKKMPIPVSNMTFHWRAPDFDVGDIHFVASALKGTQYWVIVSNPLSFNPFPISSAGCGTNSSCYRVCPYEGYPCGVSEASYTLKYTIDPVRSEITFLVGGHISDNDTYIAIGFGEDYDLVQADVTVCYMHRGKVWLQHLLVEDIQLPPYKHKDPIRLEDSDYHNGVLWCQFSRVLHSYDPIMSPTVDLYHFYFKGKIDYFTPQFILPKRKKIHTSAYKRNFSMQINEFTNTAIRFRVQFSMLIIGILISV